MLVRIERVGRGLMGDIKPMGHGVSELRIDHGPGYRVYLAQRGHVLVVLLCGGDKSTQAKDIAQAKALAKDLED
jgi:putative addiction module killer protein